MPTTQESYAEAANALPTTEVELPRPAFDANAFFTQRNRHRTILFYFSIIITSLSFSLLVIIILGHVQISDIALSTVSVSVFGEAFGIIFIIAKSVWSNHEFRLLKPKK